MNFIWSWGCKCASGSSISNTVKTSDSLTNSSSESTVAIYSKLLYPKLFVAKSRNFVMSVSPLPGKNTILMFSTILLKLVSVNCKLILWPSCFPSDSSIFLLIALCTIETPESQPSSPWTILSLKLFTVSTREVASSPYCFLRSAAILDLFPADSFDSASRKGGRYMHSIQSNVLSSKIPADACPPQYLHLLVPGLIGFSEIWRCKWPSKLESHHDRKAIFSSSDKAVRSALISISEDTEFLSVEQ